MTVGRLIKAHKERKVDMLEDLEIGKNHFYFFRINFMLRNLIINHVISVETDIRYHINIFNIFTELVRIYVYIYIFTSTQQNAIISNLVSLLSVQPWMKSSRPPIWKASRTDDAAWQIHPLQFVVISG